MSLWWFAAPLPVAGLVLAVTGLFALRDRAAAQARLSVLSFVLQLTQLLAFAALFITMLVRDLDSSVLAAVWIAGAFGFGFTASMFLADRVAIRMNRSLGPGAAPAASLPSMVAIWIGVGTAVHFTVYTVLTVISFFLPTVDVHA